MSTLLAPAPLPSTDGAIVPARPPASPPGTRRTYTLELREAPEALERVLTELRRRRCRITHLEFAAADRHRPAELVVGVEAPTSHAHLVEAWLANLVAVTAVRPLQAAA